MKSRVDGEADRRVERLRALQVGHRQIDEHHGHRGLFLVVGLDTEVVGASPTDDAVVENQEARRRDHAPDRGEADRRQPVEKFSPDAGDRRRDTSLSSSTTPAASRVCATEMLAWTPMSPPGRFFRSRTKSTRSPSIALAFAHSMSSGVEVATNFGTALMKVANGSMVATRPERGPFVVAATPQDDGVLRCDRRGTEGVHLFVVPLGEEAGDILGDTVERHELVHDDFSRTHGHIVSAQLAKNKCPRQAVGAVSRLDRHGKLGGRCALLTSTSSPVPRVRGSRRSWPPSALISDASVSPPGRSSRNSARSTETARPTATRHVRGPAAPTLDRQARCRPD